ncbi:ornithine cyclodeaminase family protein [Enterococcus sp. LJL98]
MLLLSKSMIQEFYTLKDTMKAVEKAFALFSKNQVEVPLRTQMHAQKNEGTFIYMPAYCEAEEASSIKILGMFPGNAEKGLPTINGQVLLLNTQTGVIDCLLDGIYLTQLRTGAASGVAFEQLAKKDCRKGALIGTGAQAETQLEAMLLARTLEEVQVVGLDFERTQAFVAEMNQKLNHYGTKIIPVREANEAVDGADLVIAATTATQPVFDGERIKAGATVCGVGSYQPQMQEIPASLLQRSEKIYFDSQAAVLSEAGDFIIPLEDQTLTDKHFMGDLGQVINGALVGRENDEEIIFFKSVGIAAQDVMTAKAIFEAAKEQGVGLEWD